MWLENFCDTFDPFMMFKKREKRKDEFFLVHVFTPHLRTDDILYFSQDIAPIVFFFRDLPLTEKKSFREIDKYRVSGMLLKNYNLLNFTLSSKLNPKIQKWCFENNCDTFDHFMMFLMKK
ncbi:unnamed protein product [Meganyctiphanes norvegica]|uniref:Uncharacterized protein n=1 Tax=Meganyctiphanes norvegica TaxID=48144 RepID=A0AAV2R2V5_MEGNR